MSAKRYTFKVVVSERDDLDSCQSAQGLAKFMTHLLTFGNSLNVHSITLANEWDEDTIGHFLLVKGYKDVEEWGHHVGYNFNKNNGTWAKEDGTSVDLEEALMRTLEEDVE